MEGADEFFGEIEGAGGGGVAGDKSKELAEFGPVVAEVLFGGVDPEELGTFFADAEEGIEGCLCGGFFWKWDAEEEDAFPEAGAEVLFEIAAGEVVGGAEADVEGDVGAVDGLCEGDGEGVVGGIGEPDEEENGVFFHCAVPFLVSIYQDTKKFFVCIVF